MDRVPKLWLLVGVPLAILAHIALVYGLYELKMTVPISVRYDELALILWLFDPLIAVLMFIGGFMIPFWLLYRLVRPIRQPIYATALFGGISAVWLIIISWNLPPVKLIETYTDITRFELYVDFNQDMLLALGVVVFMASAALITPVAGFLEWRQESRKPASFIPLSLAAAISLVCLTLFSIGLITDFRLRSTIRLLEHGAPAEQISAASTLNNWGDRRALPYLLRILSQESADTPVRVAAAVALGETADALATRFILDVLADPGDSVCLAAVMSLARIQERESLPEILLQSIAHELSPLIKRKKAEIRRAAADLLITLEDSSNVRDFVSSRRDVRAQALRVLSQVGDIHDLKTVVFHMEIPEVRLAVKNMTARLGVLVLFEAVFWHGGPSLWRIRDHLSWVLTELGTSTLPSLIELVCDKDTDVEGRVFAHAMAARIGGRSASDEARRCLRAMMSEGSRSDIIRTRRVLERIGD